MNAPADILPEGVTVAALVKWRDRVHAAKMAIGRARVSYVMPQLGADSACDDILFDAQKNLEAASAGLFAACEAQGHARTENGVPDFDLSTLATLDSADARELLHVLERAQELAEVVDAQRGHALPSNFPLVLGESRGSDLADSIANLCFKLRGEVSPPTGRGE